MKTFIILIMLYLSTGLYAEIIKLAEPAFDSEVSIEQAILQRRSVRSYAEERLTLKEVSQILWSAQGITEKNRGFRAAPSAGAIFPLETYIAAGNVEGLEEAVYKYDPKTHSLQKVLDGDVIEKLSGQGSMKTCAFALVITGVYERMEPRYRDRTQRYVHMEAGHAAQNVHLQVISLDLGTVLIGAFIDGQVKQLLNLPENEHPLYIMPIGRMKR